MELPHPLRLLALSSMLEFEEHNVDLKPRFERGSSSDIEIIIIDEASISLLRVSVLLGRVLVVSLKVEALKV